MKLVAPDQFQHLSDLEVVHRPTGTSVSTFRYANPEDACSSIHVNFGNLDPEFERMEIIRVACDLLRQSARR